MLKLIICILFAIAISLLLIKIFNPKKSWEEIARILKNIFISICKGLFAENKQRHVFDQSLLEELKNIVKPYANLNFEIQTSNYARSGTPFLAVTFIPNKNKLEQEDLLELTQLSLMKFRRYLSINELYWHDFAVYEIYSHQVNIIIYYAEFKEDVENLRCRYRNTVIDQLSDDYGYIHDETLDSEINDES